MGEPLKIACVGAGYWGKNLVRVFAGLPEARLKVVCDTSADIRKAVGEQYGEIEVEAQFEKVLEDQDQRPVRGQPLNQVSHSPEHSIPQLRRLKVSDKFGGFAREIDPQQRGYERCGLLHRFRHNACDLRFYYVVLLIVTLRLIQAEHSAEQTGKGCVWRRGLV